MRLFISHAPAFKFTFFSPPPPPRSFSTHSNAPLIQRRGVSIGAQGERYLAVHCIFQSSLLSLMRDFKAAFWQSNQQECWPWIWSAFSCLRFWKFFFFIFVFQVSITLTKTGNNLLLTFLLKTWKFPGISFYRLLKLLSNSATFPTDLLSQGLHFFNFFLLNTIQTHFNSSLLADGKDVRGSSVEFRARHESASGWRLKGNLSVDPYSWHICTCDCSFGTM